ncbi:cation tolerance protein CutA [Rugosibacter aromaticivorans]|uniref:Cation tolerance protein CutA n=1 Tax=Rugosibacter aromaticivorans TaxID=1565605 RepID=A0A0C5IXM6_9PROT|nr:divalent-cation tolerance protein CutA [Rugosibacter aromaticivorans]AJP47457.1 cation tolerance protein CutA [Rugosibacter aromaticivorans]TBR15691.1 MAG: divalent-cation tolerance protein CutA [Rugosibacter sp.]
MNSVQNPAQVLLVLTTLPDHPSAEALAAELVAEHLAACITILPSAQSVYRWQNRIEQASETPLIIKTTAARYAQLEAALRARHPYTLPEIIALPVTQGLPDYLAWINRATLSEDTTC